MSESIPEKKRKADDSTGVQNGIPVNRESGENDSIKSSSFENKRRRWDLPSTPAKEPENPPGPAVPSSARAPSLQVPAVKAPAPQVSMDAIAKAREALKKQKEMMAKAREALQARKSGGTEAGAGATKLTPAPASSLSSSSLPPPPPPPLHPSLLPSGFPAGVVPNLAALGSLGASLPASAPGFGSGLLAGLVPGSFPGFVPGLGAVPGSVPPKPKTAPVFRLDAQGRVLDENGNVMDEGKGKKSISTLKVNINKQKKEAFKILRPELEPDNTESAFFDPRFKSERTKLLKPKRSTFQFVEEGTFAKQAELQRMKGVLGVRVKKKKSVVVFQEEDEGEVGREGENPNFIEVGKRDKEGGAVKEEEIPDVEWWDASILSVPSYPSLESLPSEHELFNQSLSDSSSFVEGDVLAQCGIKPNRISIYIEHPVPIEPPAEAPIPPPQPLKLTKKESKKLRTQRRLAREKEKQEMIRQGLLEPPKAKAKLSNMMRVLGNEATQDPTKIEKEVRAAQAEREQAHQDRNLARKLTPAEKREKKERKLFEGALGSGGEVFVSVFKVKDLSHPQIRYKVDINAQENHLTGCTVLSERMCVIVVEGVQKSIKRYSKLMLRRIDWAAAAAENDENDEDLDRDEEDDGDEGMDSWGGQRCVLVWQGTVAKASFDKFTFHQCRTDAAARKYFVDSGVGHYWDLALNWRPE